MLSLGLLYCKHTSQKDRPLGLLRFKRILQEAHRLELQIYRFLSNLELLPVNSRYPIILFGYSSHEFSEFNS